MSQLLSPQLLAMGDSLYFHCPGCDMLHPYRVKGSPRTRSGVVMEQQCRCSYIHTQPVGVQRSPGATLPSVPD